MKFIENSCQPFIEYDLFGYICTLLSACGTRERQLAGPSTFHLLLLLPQRQLVLVADTHKAATSSTHVPQPKPCLKKPSTQGA
jgi:hypothetical protein